MVSFTIIESLKAQHCPFDNAYIMVVNITSDEDTLVIPNLKVTLLDSLGNTVFYQKWDGGTWKEDTLKLWQNPKKTSHGGIIDNENPMNPSSIRFWFANDNYVFVKGSELPGIQLKIEDVDGNENKGHFRIVIVNISDESLYPLCTAFSSWKFGEKYGFVKNYKPISIKLARIE